MENLFEEIYRKHLQEETLHVLTSLNEFIQNSSKVSDSPRLQELLTSLKKTYDETMANQEPLE
jgi:hypothetical protein